MPNLLFFTLATGLVLTNFTTWATLYDGGWSQFGWHAQHSSNKNGGWGENVFGWGDGGDVAAINQRASDIVLGYTDAQVLGQMTQIDIGQVMTPDKQLDEDKMREFARKHVGSYLNTPWTEPIDGKYGWTSEEWRAIIAQMQLITLEENPGQPLVFGIDSVHGANYVTDAVLFPQQINFGATFNADLVYQASKFAASDTAASGMHWIFGPIADIQQNPLWARTYETFSEDTYLTSVLIDAAVSGFQENNATAACLKHFIGYSGTSTGNDRTDVSLSNFDLLNYFMPPFKAGMDAGTYTVMESYSSLNGVPVVTSTKILRDLIRKDLDYDGVVVTDWQEIENLHLYHKVASSETEAVRMALTRTTLDMSMVPYSTAFIEQGEELLAAYPQYIERLRTSARRIVKMKLMLGLYDESVASNEDESYSVGNQESQDVALQAARESIVLLQNNDSSLPIPDGSTVFLTGPNADDIGRQCGGWTLRWQGYSGNDMFSHGQSIYRAMKSMGDDRMAVSYFNGLPIDGSYSDANMSTAKALADVNEYTVVVIGEDTYTEKPGDIPDLALPGGQIEYVKELASTGTKVIAVFLGGRPRLLNGLTEYVHAFIYGMLPCEFGGQAIAEILAGDVNPSGKLPLTYPKDPANVGVKYNHLVNLKCKDEYCEPQWKFGAGLSYTTFTYSPLRLSHTEVSSNDDKVIAEVTVTNSGDNDGYETVMLFLTQTYRSISVPEVKMLKKFTKIFLKAGESEVVEFELTKNDWSVYDPQIGDGLKTTAEDGQFVVSVQAETDCDVYGFIVDERCATFTLRRGEPPFPIEAEDPTVTY